MPTWGKVAIDAWTAAASILDGYVFRSVNRCAQVGADHLGEKVVWQMLKQYAEAIGHPGIAPHGPAEDLREAMSGGRRRA